MPIQFFEAGGSSLYQARGVQAQEGAPFLSSPRLNTGGERGGARTTRARDSRRYQGEGDSPFLSLLPRYLIRPPSASLYTRAQEGISRLYRGNKVTGFMASTINPGGTGVYRVYTLLGGAYQDKVTDSKPYMGEYPRGGSGPKSFPSYNLTKRTNNDIL